jgi:hypothetical protein
MSGLIEYLSSLNTADSSWGLWVNPENIDDYRTGQFVFNNGGVLDNFVCVGDLEALSFGYQSHEDALAEVLRGGVIEYKGKQVKFNPLAMKEHYFAEELPPGFHECLENKANEIERNLAVMEAEDFVNIQIPLIIEEAIKVKEQEQLIYS